ncbi:WD40 repeat domain-containing protein [Prosthecobacter sp.]|uniref:WD40 repeat domain-containing protein n=1 Tax=Prosthecobacter sp. TaxID=1965333 RepID=UPI003784CED1
MKAIKKELPFVTTWEFLLNCQPQDYNYNSQIKAAWDTLQKLRSASFESTELVRLSGHQDADIRLLALLALVAKETTDFVPVSIRLVDDFSPTLPALSERDWPNKKIRTSPQTVAEVARHCLRLVGWDFKGGANDKADFEPDAETWWKLRKSNGDWLGWYEFLYRRATNGVSPVQKEAKPAVKKFRDKVDRLPPKTRAWLLLYLADDIFMSSGLWQDWYATEQEMISAVRELGAPALVEFLQTGRRQGLKETAIDDPKKGARFISTYARHFFAPANADDLIALKQYTAAMDADPSRARQIKDLAFQHYSQKYDSWERAKVMATLADFGDEADRAVVAVWFYTELNDTGGSSAQSVFIKRLDQRRPLQAKEIVKLLVSDPSFDRLRPMDVLYLAFFLEKVAQDFSFDHNWRDEKADELRALLKNYFKIGFAAVAELKMPGRFLEKPEWAVELNGLGNSLVLQPGGSLLAVGMTAEDGGVRVLDAGDGKEKQRIAEHGRYLNVFFTPDGSKLLFHSSRTIHEIRVWDAASGEESWQAVAPQSRFQVAADKPFGLFEGDSNHDRFFWVDLATFKTVWSRDHERNRRRKTALSPDAKWIALVDEEFKTIQLLDSSKEAEVVTEFAGHASYPAKFVFSPDSTRLISVAEDERVILWDVTAKRMQSMFRGSGLRFGPVGFTADSQAFFVNSGFYSLGVYSMDGTPRFGIKCSGHRMEKVVPSRDGQFLFILVQHAGPSMGGTADKSRIECWRLK